MWVEYGCGPGGCEGVRDGGCNGDDDGADEVEWEPDLLWSIEGYRALRKHED